MSIVSVTEMWSRKTGGAASADGKTFTATFASAYQVVHSPGETQVAILSAIPVRLNDAYPSASNVWCDKVGDVQPVGPIMSIVPVSWSGEVGPSGAGDNPLNKPPEIEYYSITSTEPADTDADGVPYANVNGELQSGLTREISDMVLSVNRNFAAISASTALQYLNSTNSDAYPVLGDVWSPGQASLREFKIKPVFVNQVIGYFNVSARIEFRQPYNTTADKTWYTRYRNEGYYEKISTKLVRAVDDNKQPVSRPVLLKSTGEREPDIASAVWIERKAKTFSLPYAALGLL